MLDAGAQPTLVEAIAQLSLVVAIQLAAEKGGNICRFDCMSQGFQEERVKRLQCVLALEDQVGRILRLHDAPVIGQLQIGDDRTVLLRQFVEAQMQGLHLELARQLIGDVVIGDMNESVIQGLKSDAVFPQLMGQPGVSVEIELQPKWTPGRDAQVAQSKLLVDEIEIIGHALAAVRLQICLAARFVMPGTIRSARLHCAKDMHQSRLLAAFFQDLLHPVFFTKVFLAHVLDLQALGFCQRLRILSNAFSQGLGKFGVVEDADSVFIQIMGHSSRIAPVLQTACDHNPIIATQDPVQLLTIVFRKQLVLCGSFLDHGSTPFGSRGLSNLITFCYNMGEGKLPLGKPRAYPVSLASGKHTLCNFPSLVSACPS